jgi:hypothetical protein
MKTPFEQPTANDLFPITWDTYTHCISIPKDHGKLLKQRKFKNNRFFIYTFETIVAVEYRTHDEQTYAIWCYYDENHSPTYMAFLLIQDIKSDWIKEEAFYNRHTTTEQMELELIGLYHQSAEEDYNNISVKGDNK